MKEFLKHFKGMIFDELISNMKLSIPLVGTIFIIPARKGEFVNKYGRGVTKHKWRCVFKFRDSFKQEINERLK